MHFHLAESFKSSHEMISGEKQKTANLDALELQINSANPGL